MFFTCLIAYKVLHINRTKAKSFKIDYNFMECLQNTCPTNTDYLSSDVTKVSVDDECVLKDVDTGSSSIILDPPLAKTRVGRGAPCALVRHQFMCTLAKTCGLQFCHWTLFFGHLLDFGKGATFHSNHTLCCILWKKFIFMWNEFHLEIILQENGIFLVSNVVFPQVCRIRHLSF